jgi:5-formyltetrahydrofolate cyclo-ligase
MSPTILDDLTFLTKQELRLLIKTKIATLDDDYIKASDNGIVLRVLGLPEFRDARGIMLYRSVEREPDTSEIARVAIETGKTVAFPRCLDGGKMQACVVESLDGFEPSMFDIPAPPDTATVIAPEGLDLVIVPAVAFDAAGYRLGRGGGYYDRYLRSVSAFTVGLARAKLLQGTLPRDPHDVNVDCVITENAVLRVGTLP